MTGSPNGDMIPEVWLDLDNKPLSCTEKIKVLNENILEIRQMAKDALEDGILMGADPVQVREVLVRSVTDLPEPFSD